MRKSWLLGAGLPLFILDRVWKYRLFSGDGEIVFNEGIAWGIGQAHGWVGMVPLLVVLVIALWIFFSWGSFRKYAIVGWGFILWGAFSNLIDRIWYGAVIDWISIGDWFPWFNIADVMINMGVSCLLVGSLFANYYIFHKN